MCICPGSVDFVLGGVVVSLVVMVGWGRVSVGVSGRSCCVGCYG